MIKFLKNNSGKLLVNYSGNVLYRTIYALELTFDNIANVPGTIPDPTNINDWNTHFGLPINGTAFTDILVIGSVVKLFGGANITLPTTYSVFYAWTSLLKLNDYSGCIKVVSYNSFRNCENITEIYLPAMTNVYLEGFENIYNISKINIPSCTVMGVNVGSNDVFYGISGQNIELTIPAALMTCNGGNPDGDIQYLQANNSVTIITV